MDKFTQYNLNLTEKNKDLINKYLKSLDKIVEKYGIEKELYNDIEEMVFEKLSSAESLDQFSITIILKEIGEPEVIFSDYIDTKNMDNNGTEQNKKDKFDKNKNFGIFYERMINNGWTRDNKNAIILGISKMLGEKTGIPTWIIRTIFVLLSIFWIGVTIYLVLGFILPVEGINYKGKTTWGYIKTQLYLLIVNLFQNTLKSIRNFFLWFRNKTIYFLKNFMQQLFPIIRFMFFGLLGLILSGIFITIIIFGSLYFSSFSFNNVDFISILPKYTFLLIITGIYSIGVFMISSFILSVNGKGLNKYILYSSILSLFVAIFLSFSILFHIAGLYSNINTYTQNLEINLDNEENKTLILDINDIVGDKNSFSYIRLKGTSGVTLVNEKSNTLKIEIKYEFLGNEEITKKVENSFNESKLIKNEDFIKIENPKLFSNKIPPIAIHKELIIYVPEGYKIKFNNYAPWYFIVSNAHLSQIYDKYIDYAYTNCSNKIISYSEVEDSFICNLSDDELKKAKKWYIEKYIIANFDKISTLKHKNEYKRSYENNYGIFADWIFSNVYWIDEEKLNIEFSDMSLDIRASVNITNNNDDIEATNFNIYYVDVNYNIFKEKYYESIDPIRPFLSQEYNLYFLDSGEEE